MITIERDNMVATKGESGGSTFYAPNQNMIKGRDGKKSRCDHCLL